MNSSAWPHLLICKAMVLNWKKVDCSLWVGGRALPGAEKLEYLGVSFPMVVGSKEKTASKKRCR
ncbi:hypothetical protein ILYODFUR_036353, partial [Ilyodon furcidens]